MLIYRKVGLPLAKVDIEDIPDYLFEEIEKEEKELKPELPVCWSITVGNIG